jgi:hypothetical protein
MSDIDFRRSFGFANDLLTCDQEKVHDILAEPRLVVRLAEHGFANIRRLPKFMKHGGRRIAVADFVGERGGKKYAVELKLIRMESNPKPEPGQPTGNGISPYWWGNMLRNNIRMKIEDKKRRAITQLVNTKERMGCTHTLLAVETRRLGPSTLMETEDYVRELTDILTEYEQIDYILFVDYFESVVIVPPFANEGQPQAPSGG